MLSSFTDEDGSQPRSRPRRSRIRPPPLITKVQAMSCGGRGQQRRPRDLPSSSCSWPTALASWDIGTWLLLIIQILPSFAWTFHRPVAVNNLAASALGVSSVTVSWSAPPWMGIGASSRKEVRYFHSIRHLYKPVALEFRGCASRHLHVGSDPGRRAIPNPIGIKSRNHLLFPLWTWTCMRDSPRLPISPRLLFPAPSARCRQRASGPVPGFKVAFQFRRQPGDAGMERGDLESG